MPREYNAAYDLIERNLAAGRSSKAAYIDDAGSCTYGELAERVNRAANALRGIGHVPVDDPGNPNPVIESGTDTIMEPERPATGD